MPSNKPYTWEVKQTEECSEDRSKSSQQHTAADQQTLLWIVSDQQGEATFPQRPQQTIMVLSSAVRRAQHQNNHTKENNNKITSCVTDFSPTTLILIKSA